ncbi:MAG TPA: MogA/MoaB family molybdenum cofactor biosynthesis protein [Thermoanaerobaculia bacterium]|nr:MogA/MoaB family molybdenum cofactor biosynthesis protein [Thermoanaerobaculia bacterium]
MIRARVITCSDAAAAGARQDASGPRVRDVLARNGYEVDRIVVVPDDVDEIALAIADAIDAECRVVATTGGTGIAPRDVTPEATLRVCDRVIPGFGELMRARSLEKTPMASLSRAQAATKGSALILNLPGSPKGAEESLEIVMHLIPHALELLTGQRVERHP